MDKNGDTITEAGFQFDKKVYKIYKALKVMEKQKHLEPKFSESFNELALYLAEMRVSKL